MATTQKIRNDIAKTKEKIAEQQKRLRALETQLAEEENLEIVRMVKAVKMDNGEGGTKKRCKPRKKACSGAFWRPREDLNLRPHA